MKAAENAEDDVEAACSGVEKLDVKSCDILDRPSASGRTALPAPQSRQARTGALTIGIANNDGSPLLVWADIAIPIAGAGPRPLPVPPGKGGHRAENLPEHDLNVLVMTRLGYVRDGRWR